MHLQRLTGANIIDCITGIGLHSQVARTRKTLGQVVSESVLGMFRPLTAINGSAQSPGVQRASRRRTPSAGGGETGLSRFKHRTCPRQCRCPGALIGTTMSAIEMLQHLLLGAS
jgi:hypothetical protein